MLTERVGRSMALFVPFRALGLVTEDAPFVTQRRGKETFITLSVGDSWQVCFNEVILQKTIMSGMHVCQRENCFSPFISIHLDLQCIKSTIAVNWTEIEGRYHVSGV